MYRGNNRVSGSRSTSCRKQWRETRDKQMKNLGLLICILMLWPVPFSPAHAAPPASCASKFVGVWTYPGGTTVIHSNGTATPKCAGCVAVQNWSCNGNTYLFSNGGPPGEFSAVLIDSTHMQGSGITAVRVGGGPAAAKATPEQKPNSEGDLYLKMARAAEQYCTYADQMQAAGDYDHAADEFASAGDAGRAEWAKKAAQRASANADRCEAKQKAAQLRRQNQQQKKDPHCKGGLSKLLSLKLNGHDDEADAFEKKLHDYHCM